MKSNSTSFLTVIAKSALTNPEWMSYSNYCLNREKGLRKQAFKNLDDFLSSTKEWSFDQKRDFIKFLIPHFETIQNPDFKALPQPLHEILIKPTLEEWCKNEMTYNSPFRWYGRYYRSEKHIFKALEINPKDDLAREVILKWWTHNIYFSIHHLPDGYIGNPYEDMKLAEKIKEHISKLTSHEQRDYWTKGLDEDMEIIGNYIDWEKSNHPNFANWGYRNDKVVGYGTVRTYYYE